MPKRKKKRFRYLKIFIWLCFAALIAFFVVSVFFVKPHIYYPGFEISIPTGYKIHGIDVSRYQETINWEEVKGMESKGVKIGFAFIKATEGITREDGKFNRNWRQSKKYGVTRGAYHFFVPGRDPAKQAANFIENVELSKGDLPPVLDVEREGRLTIVQMQKDVKTFLDVIEKHYGVAPIIYTNISFYKKYFGKDFEKYPLWIAHYLQPDQPRISNEWVFWQHSETGRVNGINAPVDFNVFSGDSSDFKSLLIRE